MLDHDTLGTDLRAARKRTGMSTRSVASQLGWSHATVARTERGERVPTIEEVLALCSVYGVEGRFRELMVERAQESETDGSWRPAGPPESEQVTKLTSLEREAFRITTLSVTLMPGLFQTPDYARQVVGSGFHSGDDVEWMVSSRMSRQPLVSHPEAPRFLVFLDEPVLRRPVGGTRAMRAQLNRLLTDGERSNVAIRVLPTEIGAHPGLDGPFIKLDFPVRRSYVYLEARHSGMFLSDPDDVVLFTENIETLKAHALDEQASAELIREIKEGLPDD